MESERTKPSVQPTAVIAYQRYIIVQSPTLLIRDWLAWSIVIVVLGGFLLGFIPLVFSIACQNQKFRGDLEGARASSKLAFGFNTAITSLAVIGLVGLTVILTTHPHLLRKNGDYYYW